MNRKVFARSAMLARIAGAACLATVLTSAAPLAFGLERQTSVVYTDVTGERWCATVWSTDVGIDAQEWAWVMIDVDPRRVFHVPVRLLDLKGCGK